jgi:citrate lyase subunit beta/citryl-CoA lyase
VPVLPSERAEHARSGAGAARTWLFVPGDAETRLDKAYASDADEVVLDLEDAVDPSRKETARGAVRTFLRSGKRAWVRVNASTSEWFEDDLAAVLGSPGLRGLLVPKAQEPGAFAALRTQVGPDRGLVALVETAVGIHRVDEIASSGVDRLAFGALDLAADLGCATDGEVLLPFRSSLVLASRVAGIAAPIDGVTPEVDEESVAGDAGKARRLGFTGKLCIHPRQVAPARLAFAPSDAELEWAHRVVAASAAGAVTLVDGAMVDAPVVARARALLGQSEQG